MNDLCLKIFKKVYGPLETANQNDVDFVSEKWTQSHLAKKEPGRTRKITLKKLKSEFEFS